MNLLEFEANSLKFNENRLISIQFRNKLKIDRTTTSQKVKIVLSNKVICRVSIKIKIILNGCVVMIIFIKNKHVF